MHYFSTYIFLNLLQSPRMRKLLSKNKLMRQFSRGPILNKIESNTFIRKTTAKKQIYAVMLCSIFFLSGQVFATTEQPKAVWYRYYDQKGIANISTSVTPSHIRYGYEALDRNMQVIKRIYAYNAEKDAQQSGARASQARQKEQDAKLKRAYSNSSVAINKRDEQLASIKKQIALQQSQLKQLQSDRILFKRQEMEYFRKGNPVPTQIKDRLRFNTENITITKNTIESLQTNYRKTQEDYETIIKRLKTFE